MKRRKRSANQAGSARTRAKFFDRLDGGFFHRGMIGNAKVIVGREIEKGFTAYFDARALRGIHASQFTVQPLLAQGCQAPVQLFLELIHPGKSTIYDLRFTSKNRSGASIVNRESQIYLGGIAQRPSIMLALTLPVWARTA